MNDTLKQYTQPAFLICAAVLAVSALGMRYTIDKLNIELQKDPIPLINSLDDIDETALRDYRVVRKSKIENEEIVESLGTTDYIQWLIEDTTAPVYSPTKYCKLFITYYTGINDRIPHVPEECYFGAGNEENARSDEKVVIDYPSSPQNIEGKVTIPIRHLVFKQKGQEIWQADNQFSVIYFFKVNGKYAGNRNAARLELAENVMGKYSYFSKVEWRFFGGNNAAPTSEQAIKASKPLLETILPILETQHWPDIEKAEKEYAQSKKENE